MTLYATFSINSLSLTHTGCWLYYHVCVFRTFFTCHILYKLPLSLSHTHTHTHTLHAGHTTVQFSELANELEDVASLWYSLGLELGISCNTLDGIAGETNMPSILLRRILQSWLQNSEAHLRTKKNLVEILKRNPIRNNRLAAKIENNNGELI